MRRTRHNISNLIRTDAFFNLILTNVPHIYPLKTLKNGLKWVNFIKYEDCNSKSSTLQVFLGKGIRKIFSKFTEHPCRSVISIKFLWNFIEITLWHGCSPVNLLHIFRIPFYKNTSRGLLLTFHYSLSKCNAFLNLLTANPTKWSNGRRIVWVCLTILWGWCLKN